MSRFQVVRSRTPNRRHRLDEVGLGAESARDDEGDVATDPARAQVVAGTGSVHPLRSPMWNLRTL